MPGWKTAMAEMTPEEDLIALARKKFGVPTSTEESKAFEIFFGKIQEGERADLTPELNAGTDPRELKILMDPAYADLWKKDRVIKAEWLKWLCTDPKASAKVTSRGIRLAGARIQGELDLAWVRIQFPLRTFRCAFANDIILDRAAVGGLQLQYTSIRNLNADNLTVERDMSLVKGFLAVGQVSLRYATIKGTLTCDGGHFINQGGIALNLEDAKTRSVFMRNGFEAQGEVNFYSAVISGTLQCDGGHFTNPSGIALNFEGAKTGPVFMQNGFRAEGEVSLLNAVVDGSLECDGAQLINTGAIALNLEHAKTGSVLLGNGFKAEGEVTMLNAVVDGSLECNRGHFCNPDGLAIDATSTHIQDHVLFEEPFEVEGTVCFRNAEIDQAFRLMAGAWNEKASLDLRSAKVKTLLNDKKGWPRQDGLFLHGFTFDQLDAEAELTARSQIDWIHLQPRKHFISQPYEQTAAVLRNMGLQEEATKVMIAKNEDLTQHIPMRVNRIGDILWYGLFGPIIGFGYKPWRAFWISLVVIFLGWALFGCGYLSGLVTRAEDRDAKEDAKLLERYPKFSAFIYSLETFVPLLKLEVSQYWLPNANRGKEVPSLRKMMLKAVLWLPIVRRKEYWLDKLSCKLNVGPSTTGAWLRIYLWCHIIAGWVLTTLWVAGLTGLVKT
jgi:hypothetical protein